MTRPGPAATAAAFEGVLRGIETVIAGAALAVVVLLPAVQIMLRVLTSSGISWADEVTRHAVLWLAMAGAARAAGRGAHLAVDIAARSTGVGERPVGWGSWLGLILSTTSGLIGGGVSLVVGAIAIGFVTVEAQFGDTVGGLFPSWWSATALPAGFLLVGLHLIAYGLGYRESGGRRNHRTSTADGGNDGEGRVHP